ncbi:MAG: hypothetical protein O2990_04465 [Bacteroidetes bacterium]|nr:hypothetical protein [Bacteroidota bacterium]
MNLTAFLRPVFTGLTLCWVGAMHSQTPDLKNDVTGAEMMEELMRLTQMPLADAPLSFQGHLACNVTQGGRTTVGEIRWESEQGILMWTDQLDRQGNYTLVKGPDSPLATVSLENQEGAFMSPQMMTMAGYWSEEEPATPRILKADKKLEAIEVMGHPCLAFSGKEGKDRVVVWVADVNAFEFNPDQLAAFRAAFSGWMQYRPQRVLRNVILPEGVPLKVEWGIADDSGTLPHAMELVTLNAAAQFNLDAPNLWMQVPGRDINQVAKEMKEKADSNAASGGAKDAAPEDGE